MIGGIGAYTWIADPFDARDSGTTDPPAATESVGQSAEGSDATEAEAAPVASAPGELVVQGVAPSGSWVQIRDGGEFDPVLFEGTFTPDDSQAFPVRQPLWIRIGNTSGIELSLDEEPLPVSGVTANFIVTADGIEPG